VRLKQYKTPAWAERLVAQVCAEEGLYPPRVVWQKRPATLSTSGVANSGRIRITAGLDRRGCKQALLHELVHVIQGQKGWRTYGHDEEFYAKLFELGARYRVGAQYIKQKETWYKPRGVKKGYRLYLRRKREACCLLNHDECTHVVCPPL